MNNNYNSPNSITLTLLQQRQTVFKTTDLVMLTGITDTVSLAQRMAYAVKKGWLVSPRKGIYAKKGYSPTELANRLYTPSYLSLEYVLQREGVIFQYDSKITMISYLNREIEVEGQTILYHKVKGEILANTAGIVLGDVSTASKERAFLDMLYLYPNYHFDHPAILDKNKIKRLLSVYESSTLTQRALNIIDHA